MVDRRLSNCPLCGQQNATFIYRTDVGSGTTTARCLSCMGTLSNTRTQAIPYSAESPRNQGVLFGNYSPPRPSQEGKVERHQIESKDNTAYELTQQIANSQSSMPSEPSSPERGDSSGERAIREGPPRRRVPARRTNQTQRQRQGAVRAIMGFLGRRDVQETPRERAQRLADEDLERRSQAGRALERLNQMTGEEYAALNSGYRDSSEDEESDDENMEEDEQTRLESIIKDRKRLHKSQKRANASKGNITYELKKTINKALKDDLKWKHPSAKNLMNQKTVKKLSKGRSITTTEPRELFHPIMIEMDLRDSLKDDDEIIFQLDIGKHNGFSIPKSFLRDFLTKKKYLNHTKYQCMGTGDHALMITENNIVFEHNHRGHFQFVNGSGLGIPFGLFLRQQLLDALNAKEKYFLIHVHQNTDINPIVSADEVQWYAPPVLNSTNTHFSVEGEQISNWAEPIPDIPSNQFIVQGDSDFRGYDETHTQLTTNVSADHCQPSNGSKRHLLTIRPVNKEILKFIKHKLMPSRKRKRRGGKRKTKKKKNKRKRKKSRRIKRKNKRKKKKTRKKK